MNRVNNLLLLRKRFIAFLPYVLIIYVAYIVGRSLVVVDPFKIAFLTSILVILLLIHRDRALSCVLILGLIFLSPWVAERVSLASIPVSLPKIIGGGLFTLYMGELVVRRKKISWSNNWFLFCFFGVFVISGIIHGFGLFSYPNKVLFFDLATYMVIRYLLRDMQEVKRFLKFFSFLMFFVLLDVFLKGGEHRLHMQFTGLTEFGGSSNILAIMIAVTMPIIYYFLMFERRRFQKIIFIAMGIFFMVILLWTASRAGMIGFVVGSILMVFYTKRGWRRRFITMGLLMIIISALLIPRNVLQYTIDRYLNRTPGTIASTETRKLAFKGSISMIRNNLLIGVGPSEQISDYLFRYTGSTHASHSTPLQILLETGIIGFSFFFLCLYYAFVCLRKSNNTFKKVNDNESRWIAIIIGVSLASLIGASIFLHMIYSKLWYILLGLAQAIKDSAIKKEENSMMKNHG